jgi:hypothetical protein
VNEPLDPLTARATVRRIVKSGSVTFTDPHSLEAMRDDGLQQIDVLNILRGGWVEEAEWENGAWRYKVRTQRIVVVIELECDDDGAVEEAEELVVITVWRIR